MQDTQLVFKSPLLKVNFSLAFCISGFVLMPDDADFTPIYQSLILMFTVDESVKMNDP